MRHKSCNLSAGTLLIAPGTPLPAMWLAGTGSVARGWQHLINTGDDDELAGAGWSFFFMAGTISTTALGSSGSKRLDAALARLIKAVALQKCNCLEIDYVGMHSFLGIAYARILGHARHIQKGPIFSGHMSRMTSRMQ